MDLSADTRYHQLREEIDKLGALSGAAVDWRRVESLAGDLTLAPGPDLNVLAYLALARFKLGGPARLCESLSALAALLAAPPPELTPPRPKARGRALEWLLARLLPELRALPPAPALQPLAASLRELRGAARQALGDMSPNFGSIVQLADTLCAQPPPALSVPSAIPTPSPPDLSTIPAPSQPVPSAIPSPAHSAIPAPSPPAPSTIPLRPAPPAIPAPTDPAALDTFLTATGDALEQAARTLSQTTPLDPRAVRLLRTGLWLRIAALPPLRPDGTSNIPGLSDRDRGQLDDLHASARWPALLARSETLLVTHRLALDLQRHSAAALANLGSDAAPAQKALRAELRALLTRLPDLPNIRDRDGRPLADPATTRWLQSDILPRPRPAPVATSPDAPQWSDLHEKLRGPDRGETLADVQRQIAASSSEHARWDRRIAFAEACERAGDPLGLACFRALADDLAATTVERYNLALAARVLAGLVRTAPDPADALARLTRLDPSAAAAALAERPPGR